MSGNLADLQRCNLQSLADDLRLVQQSYGSGITLGDLLNAMIATANAGSAATAATGTLTVGGVFTVGDVLNYSLDGYARTYSVKTADTNLAGVATALAAAINADAALSPRVTASPAGAVVTLTAKRKGTASNAMALTASGATTTLAAGAATLAGGAGTDDVLPIV
jgi:phage tail sheath gpL-like